MKIERIELHLVSIPLKHYFETSYGKEDHTEHIIVKMFYDGLVGYGESAVDIGPFYTYESKETAWYVQKDFFIPSLLHKDITDIESLVQAMSMIRGHHIAKCGMEGAFWHLYSLRNDVPLYTVWGGTRTTIHSGVSIGIQNTIDELLSRIENFLNEGYKRIKIKIKPGWDVNAVKAVREQFGSIPLMVDANAAYTLKDITTFKRLDDFELMMIEQPLHFADLTEHAELQRQLKTPVCLDESITGYRATNSALALDSCRIINIKPARVGGYRQAINIHDLCKNAGIPVWCGGMLEFGIGRAFNIALCTLDNFSIPGDVSSSSRYYPQDIINPPIEFKNGELTVPHTPGIGFQPDDSIIEKYTVMSYSSQ